MKHKYILILLIFIIAGPVSDVLGRQIIPLAPPNLASGYKSMPILVMEPAEPPSVEEEGKIYKHQNLELPQPRLQIRGEIRFPPNVRTHNLLTHWPTDKPLPPDIREWRKNYDYHVALIPFAILLSLEKDAKVDFAEVHMETNLEKEVSLKPIAYHLFPTTEFVEKGINISGEVGVNLKGGFKYLNEIDASAHGDITFRFNYTPKFAKVTAGGLKNYQFFWQFREHAGVDPRGDVLVAVIFERPRTVKEIIIHVKVKVTPKGGWFHGAEPIASEADIPVEFNEGPIQ